VGRSGAGAAAAGVAMPAISSTEIRAALGAGRPVEALLAKTVLDYIRLRGLYGARDPR